MEPQHLHVRGDRHGEQTADERQRLRLLLRHHPLRAALPVHVLHRAVHVEQQGRLGRQRERGEDEGAA